MTIFKSTNTHVSGSATLTMTKSLIESALTRREIKTNKVVQTRQNHKN